MRSAESASPSSLVTCSPRHADHTHRLVQHLEKISAEGAKVLIFVATKRTADELTKYLRQDGWPALAIHGDKQQQERDWVLNEFKSGRSPIMIATDVASRGLGTPDFSSLPSPCRAASAVLASMLTVAVPFDSCSSRPSLGTLSVPPRRRSNAVIGPSRASRAATLRLPFHLSSAFRSSERVASAEKTILPFNKRHLPLCSVRLVLCGTRRSATRFSFIGETKCIAKDDLFDKRKRVCRADLSLSSFARSRWSARRRCCQVYGCSLDDDGDSIRMRRRERAGRTVARKNRLAYPSPAPASRLSSTFPRSTLSSCGGHEVSVRAARGAGEG